LTVTIYPNNGTWKSYAIVLPNAANVTAHESSTNQTLKVTTYPNGTANGQWRGLIPVDFSTPRLKGYTFVLSFDVTYGAYTLGGWYGGNFLFYWQESPWNRLNDVHPITETFNVTLPQGATLVDNVGTNVIALNYRVANGTRQSISVSTTLMPGRRFGFTIIYHDYTFRNSFQTSSTVSTTSAPGPIVSVQLIPVLPLSFGSVSLWTAIMSVFLMTGSELLSPIYSRTGILINRRRLRIAALILVLIFLISTAYQISTSMSPTVSK